MRDYRVPGRTSCMRESSRATRYASPCTSSDTPLGAAHLLSFSNLAMTALKLSADTRGEKPSASCVWVAEEGTRPRARSTNCFRCRRTTCKARGGEEGGRGGVGETRHASVARNGVRCVFPLFPPRMKKCWRWQAASGHGTY